MPRGMTRDGCGGYECGTLGAGDVGMDSNKQSCIGWLKGSMSGSWISGKLVDPSSRLSRIRPTNGETAANLVLCRPRTPEKEPNGKSSGHLPAWVRRNVQRVIPFAVCPHASVVGLIV